MINIIIVDDHPIYREGLKKILKEDLELAVVGESSDGLNIIRMIKDLDTDVVLLDLSLPQRSGLDLLKDIKYTFPKLPVLILSMHPEERFAIRCLKDGASGYITKSAVPLELIRAIKTVALGRKYVSGNLAENLAMEFDHIVQKPPHETLSDREYQVLLMIASGKKVKEIAFELGLGLRTIYTFRSRLLKKMRMKTDADLVLYALQNNLLD